MEHRLRKKPVDWLLQPVQDFINKSTTGGLVLFAAAALAIVLANSPWAAVYHDLWEHHFGFNIDGAVYLDHSLHHWINDGLMAVFFFVVGLELKREIIGGELSDLNKALLPIGAAFGGMIVPALIYIFFNAGKASHAGWGIPMATDIAFALGVLFLLGKRVPSSIKIFLTALAIADDLGAVLVIAFFYTSDISLLNLSIGLGFFLLLLLANKLGVRSAGFYAFVGIGGVWLFFLMSGVHATIAAVLIAFAIPANARINETLFVSVISDYLKRFKKADTSDAPVLTQTQLHLLEHVRSATKAAMPPLQRLEHRLHPFVTFVVMPVFAFANAGVSFTGGIFKEMASPVALGVLIGLLVGKFAGVVGFSWILVRFAKAELPIGMDLKQLFGVGLLASIGFTMSLFVANLAFENPDFVVQAKLGIFSASLLGGVCGFFYLKYTLKPNP